MIKIEYAMFLWNQLLNTYEQVTRPHPTEETCKQEFEKNLTDNIFSSCYDLSSATMKLRYVTTSKSAWTSATELLEQTATEKQRYFIDIDGTLAEFKRLSTMEELLEEGYFLNLKPLLNVVEAIRLLQQKENVEVFIISGVLQESKYAISEKIAWLEKYLPEIPRSNYIFVPCGENKNDYIPTKKESDILLDDYHFNLGRWYGIPIKLFNGVNGTSDRGWSGESVHYEDTPEQIEDKLLKISPILSQTPVQTR